MEVLIRFLTLLLVYSFSTAGLAQELKLATWNLEWLSSSASAKFPSSKRTNQDFNMLASYFKQIDPDILAFQEVNDVQAIRRVVGSKYRIYLSDRSTSRYLVNQFRDINQYTGFAIRRTINVVNKPDIRLEKSKSSRLRFATYLVIKPLHKKPIHLLSVHLKAGCTGKYYNSHSCVALKREGDSLNHWIQQRTKQKQPYMILGTSIISLLDQTTGYGI